MKHESEQFMSLRVAIPATLGLNLQ